MTSMETISADVISRFIRDALESSFRPDSPNECSLQQINLTDTSSNSSSTSWSNIFEDDLDDLFYNTASTPSTHIPQDEDILWQAVLDKNPLASDSFVYCVKTTKIYCRSTCASRRPKRDNVIFVNNAKEAKQLGYRACKRCKPDEKSDPFAIKRQKMVLEIQRKLITPTLSTLHNKRKRKGAETNIKTIASQMGISVWHLHKVFKRETGLSPEQWLSKKSK